MDNDFPVSSGQLIVIISQKIIHLQKKLSLDNFNCPLTIKRQTGPLAHK